MKVALIGGGMVGQCYGKAFATSGLTLAGLWDMTPTQPMRDFAQAHGVQVHTQAGDWLADAELILSAVYGGAALGVAASALPYLSTSALYVDMTTAAPEDMVRAGDMADSRGVHFVDVAITGAVDVHRERTPLLCSGARAADVAEIFQRVDSPIQAVGTRPGDATSLKLLRSVFTKGFEALTVECLTTAEKRGIRPQLHEILSDMDRTPLKSLMESIVRTHIPHSARRRNEIVEAQRQVRSADIEALVLPGAQQVFERTMHHQSASPYEGTTVEDALHWLIGAARIETGKH